MDGYRIERWSVEQYMDDVHTQIIQPEPTVQRGWSWTKEALNGLIWSAVSGMVFIPNLILAETKSESGIKSTYIVDGGHRTEALRRFRYGEYKVTNEIREPIVRYNRKKLNEEGKVVKNQYGDIIRETVEYDLRGKTYEDLPTELKRQLNKGQLAVTIYQNCEQGDLPTLVNIYNNHIAMNASQKALTYVGNFAKEIRKIKNTNEFLKDGTILTEKQKNGGIWERVISECVMGVYHFDNWKKAPKKICDYLNFNSTMEEYQQIEQYFNRIAPYSDKLENRKVADLFTLKDTVVWIMAFDKFDKLGLDDKNFGEFLNAFESMRNKEVNGVTWEELDENKSTKDKKVIKNKVDHILYLMKEFLGIEDNDALSNEENVKMTTENKNIIKEENIESDVCNNTQNSVQEIENNILEGIEQEDIEFYETMIEDVLPSNSELAQKAHDELVKLIDYSCEKDYDMALEKWLKTIDESVLISNNKTENYNNMKKLFIEYMLNQEKNVA